jgi:hypothetical protein
MIGIGFDGLESKAAVRGQEKRGAIVCERTGTGLGTGLYSGRMLKLFNARQGGTPSTRRSQSRNCPTYRRGGWLGKVALEMRANALSDEQRDVVDDSRVLLELRPNI